MIFYCSFFENSSELWKRSEIIIDVVDINGFVRRICTRDDAYATFIPHILLDFLFHLINMTHYNAGVDGFP